MYTVRWVCVWYETEGLSELTGICLDGRDENGFKLKSLSITTDCYMTSHDCFTRAHKYNLLETCIVLLNIISRKVLLAALEEIVT